VPDIAGKGPAADGAEIDVVEYFGKDFLGDVYSFVHYRDSSGTAHKVPSGGRGQGGGQEGTQGAGARRRLVQELPRVLCPVDAARLHLPGRRGRDSKDPQGVSQVPEYLILSMLSSGWELEQMKRRTLPNATHVDWVRVWRK
jgi:hypothetical protein